MRGYGTTSERRRQLRQGETDAEAKLWYFLQNRHLDGFKFRRQHSIGPYIVDFYCASAHVAIELDGSQHLQQQAYDEQRTAYLQTQGVARVLRFTNDAVLANPLAVLEEIRAALT